MIIILYTPGNFGSTLEYCLRSFSHELSKVKFGLLNDGSMHGYKMAYHVTNEEQWRHIDDCGAEVITAVFPNLDYLSPRETLKFYQQSISAQHRVILVDNLSIDQAQRTQLFAANKIGPFLDNIMQDKPQSWNISYRHWQDMRRSELREALSYHVDQQQDHINLVNDLPDQWYRITPDDLLEDLVKTLPNLLYHCKLTPNTAQLKEFYKVWLEKQQYVIREFSLICKISNAVGTATDFQWPPLSLYGEAILQSRLRQRGYQLDMADLDFFPSKLLALEDICCID